MYSGNHQIIGLLDCTVFGSAKDHLMFTANELVWFHKNASPSFGKIDWSDIHRCNFTEPSGWLNNEDIETGIGHTLCIIGADVKRELLITLLNNIKDLANTYFEPSESGPMDPIQTQTPTESTPLRPPRPDRPTTVVNEKAHKKAMRLYIKAEKLRQKGNHKKSSKLYFDASKLFAQSGDIYPHKLSEAFGWSEKSLTKTDQTPDVQATTASYFENAILATNGALEYPQADQFDRSNLRVYESQKYRAMANVEVAYANLARNSPTDSSGNIAAEHLRKAAEFIQSGAAAVTEAANITLKIPDMAGYHNYIGMRHDFICSEYYYCAWAFEEEDNWIEACSGYQDSLDEQDKALASIEQAIAFENRPGIVRNRDKYLMFRAEILSSREAAKIQANLQSSTVTDTPIHSGSPELDINVETVEGMVENLVSTISVVLQNNGDGEARNIDVQLTSQFFSGETNGHINSLKPGRSNRIGLSVVPTQAGSPSANFLVQYEDSTGNPFSNKSGLSLIVAQRNQERPEGGTIVHVHGDYSAGSIVKDSLIQDSTVDASASTAATTIPDPVPQSIPSTAPAVAPQSNLIAEINQLSQLHEQGILSAEQFETAKDKLLNNQ